jgi:ureidoglycolate hydrolase
VPDDPLVITANALAASAWAPFGWLPRADNDVHDGDDTLHFEWADPHLNTIEHRRDEVEVTSGGLRCAVMYRHDTHTQVLTPLDTRSVLAVAPASVGFSAPDDARAIRAFVVEPGETLVLHRGTWHWGPFPVGPADSVRLLNVQGRRYTEDNASVDVTARTGRVVAVVVAP